MKLILNVIWIGAFLWILIIDFVVIVSAFAGDSLIWSLVFAWNLLLIPVYLLRNFTKKLSGDDYISVWFKVLKIRFLNWKNKSKQKME